HPKKKKKRVFGFVFFFLDASTEGGNGGGVKKEFLHLFGKLALNPQFVFFFPNEQPPLYPNPPSHGSAPTHLEFFPLMGKLLAKMLYDVRWRDGFILFTIAHHPPLFTGSADLHPAHGDCVRSSHGAQAAL